MKLCTFEVHPFFPFVLISFFYLPTLFQGDGLYAERYYTCFSCSVIESAELFPRSFYNSRIGRLCSNRDPYRVAAHAMMVVEGAF